MVFSLDTNVNIGIVLHAQCELHMAQHDVFLALDSTDSDTAKSFISVVGKLKVCCVERTKTAYEKSLSEKTLTESGVV